MVRGAIFSSLGARVGGANVLDLFAGSGGLGLEAASRGAAGVTFVEQSAATLQCLRRNIEVCRNNLPADCALTVRRGEVFSWLRRFAAAGARFDLVLADPPYGGLAGRLLQEPTLPAIMAGGAVLALECARRDRLEVGPPWRLHHCLTHGETTVRFLSRSI
jgi:16S rRNA (guanine966-N2)-methyltransferase